MNQEQMDQLKALAKLLPTPTAKDLFPSNPELHDWVFRDIPWCTTSAWAELMFLIGEGNVRHVATSSQKIQGEPSVRGQVIISPAGLDNLRAELVRRKEAKNNS